MKKHLLTIALGLMAVPASAWSQDFSSAKAYWSGGTRLEFPDQGFTTKINVQLQPRYEFTDSDSGQDTSTFRMRRARIQLEGTALDKEFSYRIQTDFVGTSTAGTRTPDLRDAYLQWNASDMAALRIGQFKTAVGRQENNSSSKLQFPDRSIPSDYFTISRQQGARVAGKLGESVRYQAGVFNGESAGEGRNRPGADTKHTWDLGLRSDLIGKMDAFEEGDMKITEEMALNAGVTYTYSDARQNIGADLEGVDIHRVSTDLNFKYRGAAIHGEFFWMDYKPSVVDADFTALGGYIQGGYFLVPEKWELAARYGVIDCDDGAAFGVCAGNDRVHEAGLSLNHFFWGHNLKAQLAYIFMSEDSAVSGVSSNDTNKVIFQLAAYF